KATCHRAYRYSTTIIIPCIAPDKASMKQQHNERQPDHGTNDSRIRQYLQVIVVGLFQAVKAVPRIVPRIDNAKRTQPCSDHWVCFDDVEGNVPEVSATSSRIIAVHSTHETAKCRFTAKHHYATKQHNNE